MRNAKKYFMLRRRIFFGVALLSLTACSFEKNSKTDDNIIVSLGSKTLSMDEVRKAMPGGLKEEDSVRYVKAYVSGWIESRLFSEVAASEIDMSEIDRLTDEYRNRLIMLEYRRRMFENDNVAIPEDSIQAFYDKNKADFVLERPLIKGAYLKVAEDARNLRTLRKLFASDKQDDIDRLEKEVLKSAIHYDYFRNDWVDWEQVENRIPHDFGNSIDYWLRSNRKLDVTNGGFTYLLYISEYLPTGSPMPFEAARPLIIERIQNLNRQAYDAQLSSELYKQALESGTLKVNIQF